MTYDAREESEESGQPVELYIFACGTSTWYYTSAEVDVVVDSQVYTSTPITRSHLERTPERVRNNVQVVVPRTLEVADLFRIWPRTQVVSLTILRYHRDDMETVVLWMGRVVGSGFQRTASAELQCEPVSTSARRNGLRRLYQKNCPYAQFDFACTLNKEDFRHNTTVVSADGLNVVVATVTSGLPYSGGWIEWETSPGNLEMRPIKEQWLTNTMILVFPFQGITPGTAISIFPGDDHTIATCTNVYNNGPNFGGMPYIPIKNPFGGDPIY